MRSKLLAATAILTGFLVLAAATAQLLPGLEPGCELQAPFSCEDFSITGNVLAIKVDGPSTTDVRVLVNGIDCVAQESFFTDFVGSADASFACEGVKPGDIGYLSVLFNEDGHRDAISGKVVLG